MEIKKINGMESLEGTVEMTKRDMCLKCKEVTIFDYIKSNPIKGQDFWNKKNYMVHYYECRICGEEKKYFIGQEKPMEG